MRFASANPRPGTALAVGNIPRRYEVTNHRHGDGTMLRRLLLVLLLLVPGLARAQAPSLVESGTITFGLSATFPPFEFITDGKPVGFDIDLAALLAKKMTL